MIKTVYVTAGDEPAAYRQINADAGIVLSSDRQGDWIVILYDLPLPMIAEPDFDDEDTKPIPPHLLPNWGSFEGEDVSAPREPEFDNVDRGETQPAKKAA